MLLVGLALLAISIVLLWLCMPASIPSRDYFFAVALMYWRQS
ncbi:MAG: hypothetical protein WBX05_18930 [Pseudolabrys sp.]